MGKIIRVHENCSHFTRATFRGWLCWCLMDSPFIHSGCLACPCIGCISIKFFFTESGAMVSQGVWQSAVASAEEIWGCNLLTEHCPWESNACASSFLSTESTLRKSASPASIPPSGKMCFLHTNWTRSKLNASLLISFLWRPCRLLSLKQPSNSKDKGQQEKCRYVFQHLHAAAIVFNFICTGLS